MRIQITIGSLVVYAALNNSQTAELIWEHLPHTSTVGLWGEGELYCYIRAKIGLEMEYAREAVQVGDIVYKPDAYCMCIYFGPAPAGNDGSIIPASAVNVFGRIEGDAEVLCRVRDGATITVARVPS